jgi:predicted nuclease with TOPRIM domain
MSMKIERATDWHSVHTELRSQMQKIGYNPDLQRLLNNITNLVTELSKLEVTFRRTQKYSMLDDKVSEINKSIDRLEKLILMAKLMN